MQEPESLENNFNTDHSLALYRQRLQTVIDHVHNHLADPLSLQQAAELSHFSKFHFQRIFTALFGESLTQYSNRVRLASAANRLVYAAQYPITEIALDCGFSSSANFSRAFKEHYGVTPMSLRRSHQLHKQFSKADKTRLSAGQILQILENNHSVSGVAPTHITEISSQTLCMLRSPRGYDVESIWQTWWQIKCWAHEVGLDFEALPKFAFGHDSPLFTPKAKGRYEGGVVLPTDTLAALEPSIKAPFFLGTLEAGHYAVFHYRGTVTALMQYQVAIYAFWLPRSGFEPEDYPLVEHYARPIHNDQQTSSEENVLDYDIWLKIKPLVA